VCGCFVRDSGFMKYIEKRSCKKRILGAAIANGSIGGGVIKRETKQIVWLRSLPVVV
jgi:hypothetical protein